jgi:glutamate N-acetyltransferase/amino-acid N-acetyltransferase
MAVGEVTFPKMWPVAGVKIGSSAAYIRYRNRRDLVIFAVAEGSSVAGVFTQSAFAAAPVVLSKQHLSENSARYLIINTGNANAATGQIGLHNAQSTCAKLAELTATTANQVLPFSTGVIGEQLPIERLLAGIQPALEQLSLEGWEAAAHGIMTTDTIPKGASEQFELDGICYHMTGISKGAGMIRPNMATMLAFVATDAPIPQALLEQLLKSAVAQSFNRITIDGDTSTNAEVLAVLSRIMLRLAQLIVRDGEGASKFINITVQGGADTQECCDVAYSVADSPLIKTALFASDPNWGRIVMAIGKAGVADLDCHKVNIWIGDVQICRQGAVAEDYLEADGARVMQAKEIDIRIDLGRGAAQDTVYTCDLSYDYVKINADYRS